MHIRFPVKFRLVSAGAVALTACLALAPALIKKSKAFTLIEVVLHFSPERVGMNQDAEIAINNTFGARTIRATIDWGDGTTGQAIGVPFVGDMPPGHGVISMLPAVQNDNGTRVVIARVALTGLDGAALPRGIQGQIGAALHVFNKNTHDIAVSQLPSVVPAVQ